MKAAEPVAFEQLFEQLTDHRVSKEARRDLLEALLRTPGGPFMDSHFPMRRSVRNLARHVTASMLSTLNLPASCVDPDDVAHDAIIVFLEKCHRIRDYRKLKSWFWSVMRTAVLKELGTFRRHVETRDLASAEGQQTIPPQTESEASRESSPDPSADALHAAIGELSPPLRAVIQLHGLEARTHEETAQLLGIDATAVRVRWLRAKRALKSILTRTLLMAE